MLEDDGGISSDEDSSDSSDEESDEEEVTTPRPGTPPLPSIDNVSTPTPSSVAPAIGITPPPPAEKSKTSILPKMPKFGARRTNTSDSLTTSSSASSSVAGDDKEKEKKKGFRSSWASKKSKVDLTTSSKVSTPLPSPSPGKSSRGSSAEPEWSLGGANDIVGIVMLEVKNAKDLPKLKNSKSLWSACL